MQNKVEEKADNNSGVVINNYGEVKSDVNVKPTFDYLDDIKEKRPSIIFDIFLNSQSTRYLDSTKDERKVIDFIAGMTDDLFIREVKRVQ